MPIINGCEDEEFSEDIREAIRRLYRRMHRNNPDIPEIKSISGALRIHATDDRGRLMLWGEAQIWT